MKEDTTENQTAEIFLSAKTASVKINQRSELAQEILSTKPGFAERWSLYIFLLILLTITGLTWFISYPEIIEVNATLTAQNAPKEIISLQEGRVTRIFVHNNEKVERNSMIAWIDNTADHQEVIYLAKIIDRSIERLARNRTNIPDRIDLPDFRHLGELQSYYQDFISAWQEYNDYRPNGFYVKKRQELVGDLKSLTEVDSTINQQKKLTKKDIELAQESYNMNKILLDQKVLTNEEFRVQNSRFVNKQLALPTLEKSAIDNHVQRVSKIKEIEQIDHDMVKETTTYWQVLQTLKSKIDEWEKKFIIKSPVSGNVYFTIPLQENQFIANNKLIGYVSPTNSISYAETILSQYNFGKINTGLEVQLRFDAYPFQENGYVNGKIDYISNVPSDSGFRAMIKLSAGLKTNINRPIPYKPGLKAHALIITKNMRLLQYLYYNIVKSISLNTK